MIRTYPLSKREILVVICRRMIADALRENGFDLSEQGVIIVEGPSEDRETYRLLKSEEIEYPNPGNALKHLEEVWAVKGTHQEKPDQLVALLVGEYTTFPSFTPLGRLDGDRWVSPLV